MHHRKDRVQELKSCPLGNMKYTLGVESGQVSTSADSAYGFLGKPEASP